MIRNSTETPRKSYTIFLINELLVKMALPTHPLFRPWGLRLLVSEPPGLLVLN